MKRKLLAGIAFVGWAFSLHSAPISPQQALSRVGIGTSKGMQAPGAVLAHTTLTESGDPAVYVFNRPLSGGYMVVSADDMAYPLLGYTDHGSFDEEQMPPQLKWWLNEYARQISYATENSSGRLAMPSKKEPSAQRDAISPMIKTKWDQVEPYNSQCPLYGTKRTYTGCVATAMAQVMKYWSYPEVGQGSISYDCESLGKRLSLNFANRRFEWDKMLDYYDYGQYSEEEAAAVAYLMKAAGYAVKSEYAEESSGALAMNIAQGLVKYFNYDPNIFYTIRMYYSTEEWEEMIYSNLKNVGPILYGGASMLGGGHSFVCDGYDGNGYFHFNWGWSGMSDGYFSLDALNPQALGSGGGGGGGYNFTQDAVFGIQPPTGLPAEDRQLKITQIGSLAGYFKDNYLNFDLFANEGAMWVNYNPTTMKVMFGAIFEPQGDTEGDTKYFLVSNQELTVPAGYGTDPAHLDPKVNLATAGLSDGTYKVTFATVAADDEDAEYVPVQECYGCYNYIMLKKDGAKYSLDINSVDRLAVKEGQIIGDLYYGCLATVSVTVVNENDVELTQGFAPVLIKDDAVYFMGESVLLTVPPHSEVTKEWTTSFAQLQQIWGVPGDTEYLFTFFDEASNNFYEADFLEPVIMKPVDDLPSVVLVGAPVIKAAEVVREYVGSIMSDVYVVKDRMNINVEATLRLLGGIYSYNTYACTCLPDWDATSDTQVELLAYSGYPMTMDVNEESVFSTTLAMPMAEPDKQYMLMMAYDYQGMLVGVDGRPIVFRIANPSGVDSIEDNGPANTEIYNLQGISLGSEWDSLPAGIYILNGKKVVKK